MNEVLPNPQKPSYDPQFWAQRASGVLGAPHPISLPPPTDVGEPPRNQEPQCPLLLPKWNYLLERESSLNSLSKSINRLLCVAQFFYSTAILSQYALGAFLGIVDSFKNLAAFVGISGPGSSKCSVTFLQRIYGILSPQLKALFGSVSASCASRPRKGVRAIWNAATLCLPLFAVAFVIRYAYALSLIEPPEHSKECIGFARVLRGHLGLCHDEISLDPGELVAILEADNRWVRGNAVYWKGRKENGDVGYFPSDAVELLKNTLTH